MRQSDPFDPDNLRLNGATFTATKAKPKRPPRHRPGEWFLRGPVPWPWLDAAAQLPGRSLALSLCLWREAGRRQQQTVKLCLGRVGLRMSKDSARRALRFLEAAELVSVCRKPGRGLEVTLLEYRPERPATDEG